MYQSIVQTVRMSMWCGMASSAMAHSATSVTTRTVRGTFFSSTIKNQGHLPEVKQQMVDMALNGSGIKRYSPCFKGSVPTTVITTLLKRKSGLQQVNEGLLQRLEAEQVQVIVHKVIGSRGG